MGILYPMKRPIYVRPLSDAERKSLKAGLRSPDAFTLRRCQILLASADAQNAYQIAANLGCNPQTARNAIHKFNEEGLEAALERGSRAPHSVHRAFDGKGSEAALRGMLHRSPREFGGDGSLWTLAMAAEVSFEERLTERRVTGETVRATLARMGVRWRRAKHWITSPDPLYARKKQLRWRPTDESGRRQRYLDHRFPGRVLMEQSGSAEPPQLQRSRRALAPRRAVGRQRDDAEPKAISCYGLYMPGLGRPWLRFVDGRPVSAITTRFLEWWCQKLQALGKEALVLIWDNAGWHISREVRRWIGTHNREVKRSGGEAGVEDRHLFAAQEESVAQCNRAQMGSRQTQGCRARRSAWRL